EMVENDLCLFDSAPLAARLLALGRAERAEEFLEACVSAVVPMELAALARDESRALEQRALLVDRKQHVQRRCPRLGGELAGGIEQVLCDGGNVGSGRNEYALARRGRERHCRDELRIIPAAAALVGVGPAPVEHEFAARVVFEIERQRAEQRAGCVLDEQVRGSPRRAAADAAA